MCFLFRLSLPPLAVAQNKTERVKTELMSFLEASCAESDQSRGETCDALLTVHENPAATTGIELRCLSDVSDKEHLRALLHGGATLILDCFGDAFNVRARDKDDEGPVVEFKRPVDPEAQRYTA